MRPLRLRRMVYMVLDIVTTLLAHVADGFADAWEVAFVA
jgi:hypothetical protein